MTIAFCLGNGVSRAEVDLNTLSTRGKIYGCNGLYRNFTPDVLVATDRPIATEIQESGYSGRNVFYTRRPIERLGAKTVPKQYYGFSSGPLAIGIASIDNMQKIYLLGFDLGPNLQGKFNNIFADTQHYKRSSDHPTYTGNWIKQISTVIKDFPNIQYVRVVGETSAKIDDFTRFSNLQEMPIMHFLERINNVKDL